MLHLFPKGGPELLYIFQTAFQEKSSQIHHRHESMQSKRLQMNNF